MAPHSATNDLVTTDIETQLEGHRRELTGYCYRMLGSGFEAEDAVQETFIRAWKNIDGFEGRSSLRSWLYRIATNVCLDMVRGPQRRARPMEFGPSSPVETATVGPVYSEKTWVQPIPDARVLPSDGDPADLALSRETIRLAFIAALQNLPPRQRAVLILREVLRWQASEVAELLDTTVASVNSALQRARDTMGQARRHRRQRRDGIRRIPVRWPGRPHALGAADHRDRRLAHHGPPQLSEHRALRLLRPSRVAVANHQSLAPMSFGSRPRLKRHDDAEPARWMTHARNRPSRFWAARFPAG